MSRWLMAPLGEVCEIIGGGTPRRNNSNFFGGDIPWATPTDVTALNGSLEISSTRETLSREGLAQSSARLFPAGTVLLTSRATIGFTAVAQVPMTTNQGFANFICGPRILPEFLALWFPTRKAELLRLSGSTTFKEISKSNLRKVRVPLPPLSEQRRIVDILNRANGIRRLRREALEKARQIIPALFVEMFGDPMNNPNKWPITLLGDLVDHNRGISYGIVQRGPELPDGVPVVRISNIVSNSFDGVEVVRTSSTISNRYRRTILIGGELLLSIRGTVGKVAIAPTTAAGWNVSREVAVIPLNGSIDPKYVQSVMLSDFGQRFMLGEVRGIAQSGVNLRDVRKLPIPVPPAQDQGAFASRVADIRAMIAQQKRSAAASERLMNSLMAEVFG